MWPNVSESSYSTEQYLASIFFFNGLLKTLRLKETSGSKWGISGQNLNNSLCTPLYIGYESESVNTNPPPPHGVVVLEKQELKQKEGARLRSSCAQQQCSRVVVEHNVQESRSFVQKYESGLTFRTGLFYANKAISL